MPTSANVVNYDIIKQGNVVHTERLTVMCKKDWVSLFMFLSEYLVQGGKLTDLSVVARGHTEDYEEWEDEPISMHSFLNSTTISRAYRDWQDKRIKEALDALRDMIDSSSLVPVHVAEFYHMQHWKPPIRF